MNQIGHKEWKALHKIRTGENLSPNILDDKHATAISIDYTLQYLSYFLHSLSLSCAISKPEHRMFNIVPFFATHTYSWLQDYSSYWHYCQCLHVFMLHLERTKNHIYAVVRDRAPETINIFWCRLNIDFKWDIVEHYMTADYAPTSHLIYSIYIHHQFVVLSRGKNSIILFVRSKCFSCKLGRYVVDCPYIPHEMSINLIRHIFAIENIHPVAPSPKY